MNDELLTELKEAAQPFAELLEYPEELEQGVPVLLEVLPSDILRLRAALLAV